MLATAIEQRKVRNRSKLESSKRTNERIEQKFFGLFFIVRKKENILQQKHIKEQEKPSNANTYMHGYINNHRIAWIFSVAPSIFQCDQKLRKRVVVHIR